MDFALDATTAQLRDELLDFMASHVYPAEGRVDEQQDGCVTPPVVRELQAAARSRGLWNLFMPDATYGAGLTTTQYAPLAEITGRSPRLAPVALNCAAPDTGNMELLAQFGTQRQREQWLLPLLSGEIRSAFAMTEPDVASSDARNIQTSIRRERDVYVVSGRKWFATGALNPECALLVVMGRTAPDEQSMVLVPRDTEGLLIRRGLDVFGYSDADHGGHAEIEFNDVRVPVDNLLGEEGAGFTMSQARLGPGRVHHCMRLIGMAERALDLMCQRAITRVAFSKPLAEQGVVRNWIAESRVRIEQARLLVLKAAWLMDTLGNQAAHREIQAIKIAVPRTVEWVLDKAIQTHGAAGMSQDTPLAFLWTQARALRIADGPDEVHLRSLARRELDTRR